MKAVTLGRNPAHCAIHLLKIHGMAGCGNPSNGECSKCPAMQNGFAAPEKWVKNPHRQIQVCSPRSIRLSKRFPTLGEFGWSTRVSRAFSFFAEW